MRDSGISWHLLLSTTEIFLFQSVPSVSIISTLKLKARDIKEYNLSAF